MKNGVFITVFCFIHGMVEQENSEREKSDDNQDDHDQNHDENKILHKLPDNINLF